MKTAAETNKERDAQVSKRVEKDRVMKLVSRSTDSSLGRAPVRISLCENLLTTSRETDGRKTGSDIEPGADPAAANFGDNSSSRILTKLAIAGAIGVVAGLLIARWERRN